MKIKKGDTVKILYGKDRGKLGPVVALDSKKQRVIVEGLNLYKRHLKGDGRTRTSEIITIEKPFPISKVMLVCPLCNKPTRVSFKLEKEQKIRICKKCGGNITDSMEKSKEEKKGQKKTEEKENEKPKKETVKKEDNKTKTK